MALTSSSRTERFKQGKALRHTTPREAHADLKGSLSRNAVALLTNGCALECGVGLRARQGP